MSVHGASRQITAAVITWDGINIAPHRFGGTEYQLGTREIGHIHSDHMVDIPFPKAVRNEIVSEGQAQPHHILPETGWISFYIHEPDDVNRAIDLLRRSYEIASAQKQKRNASIANPGEN